MLTVEGERERERKRERERERRNQSCFCCPRNQIHVVKRFIVFIYVVTQCLYIASLALGGGGGGGVEGGTVMHSPVGSADEWESYTSPQKDLVFCC